MDASEEVAVVKVTMNLTEVDSANADFMHKGLQLRSKAQAVSFALTIARFLLDSLLKDPHKQVILRNGDGSLEKVVIPEIETARSRMREAAAVSAA